MRNCLNPIWAYAVGVLIMASDGSYIFEQEPQSDACGSIPLAIWWAVATLTTVGNGDVTDHSRCLHCDSDLDAPVSRPRRQAGKSLEIA